MQILTPKMNRDNLNLRTEFVENKSIRKVSRKCVTDTRETDHFIDLVNNQRTSIVAQSISPHDFQVLKFVGMGSFGKVLQVRHKKTNKILAMKVISKSLVNKKPSLIEILNSERNIMIKIRHPFIVKMHCSFQSKNQLFIVMDFLAGGELLYMLGREGIFLEKQAMIYIGEIVLALEHLHSHGILHRDLKPENILLGADGHLCLTDFGLAKDFRWDRCGDIDKEEERAMTICGTQEYMAPEMVARKGYGKAVDFWSLGCIAYEMLSGTPPFQSHKGSKDLFRKIMCERVRMPDGISSAACKLLKGLLNRNAVARLGATKGTMFQVGGISQLKQECFFKGLCWQLLEKKEIKAPIPINIKDNYDLSYFRTKVTVMNTPRSLIECSDDFLSDKCSPCLFHGFSYTRDDFGHTCISE